MTTNPADPGSSAAQDAPPLEFGCGSCGRLLKVPAAAAGKQAKCPQCDSVQPVPAVPLTSVPLAAAPLTGVTVVDSSEAGLAAPAAANTVPSSGSPFDAVPDNAPPPVVQRPAGFEKRAVPEVAGESPFSLRSTNQDAQQDPSRETPTKKLFDRVRAEIAKIYVGQDELVMGTLVALFSSGHILIESVPGLGKTLFVRTLGHVLGCQFGRIQFTADLMPSDITGAPIFDMKTQEFRFRPGPVFTQLLLADEINRAPAKTHAALLETMQEYRVTVDGTSHSVDRPFLVLATQNPIESEGTYNLPEAQLDRFMFKLVADYPMEQEEAEILKLHSSQHDINRRLDEELQTVTSTDEIMSIVKSNAEIRVEDKLIDYVNKVVRLTRQWRQFHLGASPRAGIALIQGARTLAAFSGRDYAVPDDVVQIMLPALRHRVCLTAESEVEGHNIDDLLTELIRSVEVPRI